MTVSSVSNDSIDIIDPIRYSGTELYMILKLYVCKIASSKDYC